MTLASRLRNSVFLERLLARLLAAYLALCWRTTRWQGDGHGELRAALAEGPVVILLWHSRTVIGAHTLPRDAGRFAVLHDPAPAGRLAGATVARVGVRPVRIGADTAPASVLREAMALLRDGTSLIVTGDGPDGPARQLRQAPIDWLRIAGRPVFLFAVTTRRQRRLSSWDRLLFPLPFTRGAFLYRRWGGTVPRRITPGEAEALRATIGRALDAVTAECDAMAGLPPGP